jgi:hypothetical protein
MAASQGRLPLSKSQLMNNASSSVSGQKGAIAFKKPTTTSSHMPLHVRPTLASQAREQANKAHLKTMSKPGATTGIPPKSASSTTPKKQISHVSGHSTVHGAENVKPGSSTASSQSKLALGEPQKAQHAITCDKQKPSEASGTAYHGHIPPRFKVPLPVQPKTER